MRGRPAPGRTQTRRTRPNRGQGYGNKRTTPASQPTPAQRAWEYRFEIDQIVTLVLKVCLTLWLIGGALAAPAVELPDLDYTGYTPAESVPPFCDLLSYDLNSFIHSYAAFTGEVARLKTLEGDGRGQGELLGATFAMTTVQELQKYKVIPTSYTQMYEICDDFTFVPLEFEYPDRTEIFEFMQTRNLQDIALRLVTRENDILRWLYTGHQSHLSSHLAHEVGDIVSRNKWSGVVRYHVTDDQDRTEVVQQLPDKFIKPDHSLPIVCIPRDKNPHSSATQFIVQIQREVSEFSSGFREELNEDLQMFSSIFESMENETVPDPEGCHLPTIELVKFSTSNLPQEFEIHNARRDTVKEWNESWMYLKSNLTGVRPQLIRAQDFLSTIYRTGTSIGHFFSWRFLQLIRNGDIFAIMSLTLILAVIISILTLVYWLCYCGGMYVCLKRCCDFFCPECCEGYLCSICPSPSSNPGCCSGCCQFNLGRVDQWTNPPRPTRPPPPAPALTDETRLRDLSPAPAGRLMLQPFLPTRQAPVPTRNFRRNESALMSEENGRFLEM